MGRRGSQHRDHPEPAVVRPAPRRERNPRLQEAWNTLGAAAVPFEAIAQLPEEHDDSGYPRGRLLAKLLGEWVKKLQAIKI
jgi:hypothetical protein